MVNIDKEKITCRRADVRDIKTLVEFRILFLSEFYDIPENATALQESLRKYFTSAMQSGRFISWLAEYDGKVVGCSGMSIWETIPNAINLSGKRGYILNMYTIPEARQNGVCTTLLDKLIEDAKSSGVTYLHLRAGKAGINVYKKAGFKEPESTELDLRLA